METRCSECRKFVSFEEGEPELENEEVQDTGDVFITVRIHDDCAECGTELREYTFELEGDVSAEIEEWNEAAGDSEHTDHDLVLAVDDPQRGDYMKVPAAAMTRKKPVPTRYQKRMITVDAPFTVTCSGCTFTYGGVLHDEVQASGMEELV